MNSTIGRVGAWGPRLAVCGLALVFVTPNLLRAQGLSGGLGGSGGSGSSGIGGLGGGSSMGRTSSGGTGGGSGLSGTFFGSGNNPLGSGTGTGGLGGGTGGFGGGSGYGGFTGGGFSGGTSTGISTSNPFYSYFATPLAFGVSSSSGFSSSSSTGSVSQVTNGTTTTSTARPISAFGLPVYRNLTGTGTGTTGAFGGTGTAFSGSALGRPGGGVGGLGAGMGATPGGLGTAPSTTPTQAPRFVTGVGFPIRTPAASQVQLGAQTVLANSSLLDADRKITVSVKNGAVVLSGSVADEHNRRLAEALVRTLPGVHDVVNELKPRASVAATQPAQGSQ
jgi:hypothetical protein